MRVLLPQLRKLLLLLFTISTVLFVLLRQAGDPAYVLAGATATPEQIEAIRQQFGLDGPLFAQYLSYLWNLLQLDFGESLLTGDSALLTVLERLPRRLQLALMAIVLSIAVAIPTGAWLGSRPGQPGRRLVSGLVFVLQGSPGLVLALLLTQLFAVEMMWLPSLGHGAADWKTRALPTLSLAMCLAPSLRPGLWGPVHPPCRRPLERRPAEPRAVPGVRADRLSAAGVRRRVDREAPSSAPMPTSAILSGRAAISTADS